jgi:hypothetical protein
MSTFREFWNFAKRFTTAKVTQVSVKHTTFAARCLVKAGVRNKRSAQKEVRSICKPEIITTFWRVHGRQVHHSIPNFTLIPKITILSRFIQDFDRKTHIKILLPLFRQ